ncbi:hypothetical protein ABEB36_000103 [Hypothenemus hampei]|uniref:THAP-type domain-containing protein n=1 Tax=Hypothenemus hampei TaxID=57062 RepID=A0ABD1FA91_HYPHA
MEGKRPKFHSYYCIICARSDLEVQNMYCFPRNKNKAQIWLDNMNMKANASALSSRSRICNLHFGPECFANSFQLNRNDIPTLAIPIIVDAAACDIADNILVHSYTSQSYPISIRQSRVN